MKIGVFSMGRITSTRCSNKMLKPFSDTTLVNIVLSKLSHFGENGFFVGYEEEFKEKCNLASVRFVQRTKESALDSKNMKTIYSFLKPLDFDYFLFVNSCQPFLSIETIKSFLNKCIEHKYKPAFSILERQNYFISKDKKPLNFKFGFMDTGSVKVVYEFLHSLYFFSKNYFFEKEDNTFWDWNEVQYIIINDKYEVIDVNTERDFEIAEKLYKVREK